MKKNVLPLQLPVSRCTYKMSIFCVAVCQTSSLEHHTCFLTAPWIRLLRNALTSKLWASLEHKLLSELLNPVQVFLALLQQQFRNQSVKAYGRLTSREGSYYTRMINISYCIPGHEANLWLNTGDTLNTTWLEKILFSKLKKKKGGKFSRFYKTLKFYHNV